MTKDDLDTVRVLGKKLWINSKLCKSCKGLWKPFRVLGGRLHCSTLSVDKKELFHLYIYILQYLILHWHSASKATL